MDIAKLIKLEPGHYVVAVSGGVDSMVLMNLLAGFHLDKDKPVRFTVAHFDHGIRDHSHLDRILVHEESVRLGLPYVYAEANLGAGASEDEARQARYDFLRQVQSYSGARAIITAHHYDDFVETALLNLVRGTGRKGMSSLKSRHDVIRPFIHVPKDNLRVYAQANGLVWHEDSTNTDQKYRRNYIRHSVIKKAKAKSPKEYHQLLKLLRRQRELNHAIDSGIEVLLHTQPSRYTLRRRDVIDLPYRVATEFVAQWLRQNGKRDFNKWLVDRVTVGLRTAQPNTAFLVDSSSKISFGRQKAEFVRILR